MYEHVFDFTDRPFTSTPFVKHYFAADSIQQALGQSRICIDRASGPVVVIGAPGTGKSLMLAMLEQEYQSQFNVVNLGCSRLEEREDLWQSIMFELKQPIHDLSESELRFALLEYLKPSESCPNGVLLLIDEAHSLPISLLDELRLITNFVRDGVPRLRLVMAGNQQLEENLTDPRLASLNQRVATRCFLTNMQQEETGRYVTEHVERVGGNAESLFTSTSLTTLHEVTDGCPRLINQVCDLALILAGTHGEKVVTDECIREAWADVQNIPGHWPPVTDEALSPTGASSMQQNEDWSVIEFGQLDGQEAHSKIEAKQDEDLGAESPQTSITETEPTLEADPTFEADPISDTMLQPEDDAELIAEDIEHYPTDTFEEYQHAQSGKTDSAVDDQSDLGDYPEPSPEDTCDETGSINLDLAGVELEQPVNANNDPVQPVSSDPSAQAIDPFAETFDEEEHLFDRFAPFVANHNLSSLSVTTADLESLVPSATLAVDGTSCDNSYECTPECEDDPGDGQEENSPGVMIVDDPGDRQLDSPAFDAARDPTSMGNNNETTSENALSDGDASQMTPADDNSFGDAGISIDEESYHTPAKGESSQEVAKQAEEILDRLKQLQSVSCETNSSCEEQTCHGDELTPDSIMRSATTTRPFFSDSEFETQNPAIEETQQILNEVLEQKNIIAEQQAISFLPTEVHQQSPSEILELSDDQDVESVDESTTNDDREMIIVSRMEQQIGTETVDDAPIPFPSTPVSTGRAERMEYEKLFDQLRSHSENSDSPE